jgi:predicted nucleic acid-binding protein
VALSWRDGPWVADTSAWARASHPDVAPKWKAAADAAEIIACPVITLELLYDAPDRKHVEDVAAALAEMRQALINGSVTNAAERAMQDLAAEGSAGGHRVRVPDVLLAAAAAQRGFGVLHYDHHFDKLAKVLNFTSQWIAPKGSID